MKHSLIGVFVLFCFISSTAWLFLDNDNANDWSFQPQRGGRRLLSSEDDLASDLRTDYHDLRRHNDNNRFCSFHETGNDTDTHQTTYDCDWKAYGKNLVYICIPGVVVAIILVAFCTSFAILRKCGLCGSDLPSNGCLCTDTHNVPKYRSGSVCFFKTIFFLLLLVMIALAPFAWWGNHKMIDGTNDSGDDAVSAAEEVNSVALDVYQQSLLVPNLDESTQDLINETISYSESFLDDAKTFRDNMKLANFWRNIVLSVTLALLVVVCLFAIWATWSNSPRCVSFTKAWLITFITVLAFLLVVTTATSVVTSDFCWEVDYALEAPENIHSSYIGVLMDCNEEDYPFAELTSDLYQSQDELVNQICLGWSAYCTEYTEVTCNTVGFNCLDDLVNSQQIYNRTTIYENGETYTISECATECTDSELASSSSTLNEYLVGLDALNEIIVEVTPYLSCDWIYATLDEISNPTCVDAIIGGAYLSVSLLLEVLLAFITAGMGFMAIKRFDIRNRELQRGDYYLAPL